MQGLSPTFYPAAAPGSRVLLALACANSPRFQPGNDCGKSGYGRDNGLRVSRVTQGNIKASGAKETRRFTDKEGRQVVEHKTDDGRTFHEVTHASGRRSFHSVQGPAKAAKPKAAAKAQPANGDAKAAVMDAALKLGGGKHTERLRIADLRAAVGDKFSREEVDGALMDHAVAGHVVLVHMDDPREKTAADKVAVFKTPSGEERHLLYVTPAGAATKPTTSDAPFPRYRTPDGTMVQVGQSGRIVGGDAKAAGLMGNRPADVGAVPEAEHFAAKAKATAAGPKTLAVAGKAVTVTPAMQRAAAASAVPRPPSREAAAKAAERMGEGPATVKASPSPAAAASPARVQSAVTAVRDHLSRLDTDPESQGPAEIDKTVAKVKALTRDEAHAVTQSLGIAGKPASAADAARKVRGVLENQAEAAGRVQTMAEERRREPVRGFSYSAAAPASRTALSLARAAVRPAAVVLSLSAAEQRANPGAVIDPPPGMPSVKGGQRLHYRKYRIAKARPFYHMATGKAEEITPARIGLWASAFDGRAKAGVFPFIYPRHLEAGEQPDARHTLGYVVGHERDAASGDWYSIEQYVGDAAARVADANGRSVTIMGNGVDPDGAAYPEYLHHLALTPMAALPEAGYVPTLAASGAVVMAPVYVCGPAGCGCQPGPSRAALLALSAAVKHEYSSTQVNLSGELAQAVLSLAHEIPDDELADDGRETEPHVTVKYGLHADDAGAVREVLKAEKPARIRLGRVSVFPASADRPSDVVKVDVHSPDLHRMHGRLLGALPHTDTHPTYQPHVTLAYVKPGKGAKYAGRADLAGRVATVDRIRFSDKHGRATDIPLAHEP
jgi:2'-5' RNA ligase